MIEFRVAIIGPAKPGRIPASLLSGVLVYEAIVAAAAGRIEVERRDDDQVLLRIILPSAQRSNAPIA